MTAFDRWPQASGFGRVLIAVGLVAIMACRPSPTPLVALNAPDEAPLPQGARLIPLRELIPHVEATIDELQLLGSWSRSTGQWVYIGSARSSETSGNESGGAALSEGDGGNIVDVVEEPHTDGPMQHVIRAVSVREDASRLVWLVGPGEGEMQRDRSLETRVHERWESARGSPEVAD